MLIMSSLILALVASFFYATTNQIDKTILEKYFRVGGPGTLIIYSTLLSILSLFVIVPLAEFKGVPVTSDLMVLVGLPKSLYQVFSYVDLPVLSLEGVLDCSRELLAAIEMSLTASEIGVLKLFVSSVFNVLVLGFYLYALDQDEPAVAIIFYQLVPVFVVPMGWWLLDEAITSIQYVGMGFILAGTGFVSFKIDGKGFFRMNWWTVLLMSVSSFFWAAETVIFKDVAQEVSLLRALFFEAIVMTLLGVLIFIFIPRYRLTFLQSFRTNSKEILVWNLKNEVIFMIANALMSWATYLSTAAFVMSTNTYQAVFVLIFSLHYRKVRFSRRELKQIILAIMLTGIGVWILLASGVEY